MPTRPNFVVQVASLYASGDNSTFTGSGGPMPFEPYSSTFAAPFGTGDVVANPFNDSVNHVDAGDQVTFAIVLDNFGGTAYDLKLRDIIPVGFAIPASGADVVAQTAAGTVLNTSGNLFDSAGGLVITDPVAAYDISSGNNVVVVTFTLDATANLAVPAATVSDTAQLVSYAASSGGANLSGYNSTALSASTTITTGTMDVAGTAAPSNPSLLQSAQTASYDITITLPEGSIGDLRVTEATPASGAAGLTVQSVQIVSFGGHLSASAPVVVQPDGSIALGTVTDTPDNLETSDDQIVVRVTVSNGGTTSGTGTLQTTVSAADPNHAGGRTSQTITNTISLATPNTPPALTGVSASQNTTSSAPVLPFAQLGVVDPDFTQTETLTITLSDRTIGTLSGTGLTTDSAGNYVLSGTAATVQAEAQALTFTPSGSGTEQFGLTVSDGIASASASAALTVAAPQAATTYPQFLPSTQTLLTATPSGSTTVIQAQSYGGIFDGVQSQFLYDGAGPLAIVAQSSNVFVSSDAALTAVSLQGGSNVLDMTHGSAFVTSGSGNDAILLDAGQASPTWNTIVNFHAGDSIVVYGFHAGTSTNQWIDNEGAPGWTGATLHMDVNGDGIIDSSITFAGKSLAAAQALVLDARHAGGKDFLYITSN